MTANPVIMFKIQNRIALLLLLFFSTACSQGNVRLSGFVYDADDGSPLLGAVIGVTGTSYGTETDPSGHFEIQYLPSGNYRLSVQKLGYQSKLIEAVRIQEDQTARVRIGLTPAPLSADSIFVYANRSRYQPGAEGNKIILSKKDIESYKSLGLPALLQQVPGVTVESTGGANSSARIRIHGSQAKQVLVLLDGQRLNNPQTGDVDLNLLPLDQIEKIEIIRQGNSALYGSNAFGGVVLLHSAQVRKGGQIIANSRLGSFSTAAGNLNSSFSSGPLDILASYRQSYSRQNFSYDYQGTRLTRENAWYRHQKMFGKVDFQNQRQHLGLVYHHFNGRQGLPSAYYEEMNPFDATKQDNANIMQLNYRWFYMQDAYLEANAGYYLVSQIFNNENDLSPFTRYKTKQTNSNSEAKVNSVFQIGGTTEARLGFSYLEEKLHQQDLLYPKLSIGQKKRHTIAGFGSFEHSLPAIQGLFKNAKAWGAIRYEKYFQQNPAWYPLLGFSLMPAFTSNLNLSGSWYRAIRYPDFNSLFWKGDARARGNTNLLPERKTGWNLTLHYFSPFLFFPQLDLHFYREKIYDLIFWHRTVSGIWEPRNEQQALKSGIDIGLEQTIFPKHIFLQSTYSWIDAINKSDEPNRMDKRIVFIPRHSLNTSLRISIKNIEFLLVHRFVSQREIVPSNTGVPLDGYQIWNASLSTSKNLSKIHLDMGMGINNLASAGYEILRGYPMPGREFTLSLKFKYPN